MVEPRVGHDRAGDLNASATCGRPRGPGVTDSHVVIGIDVGGTKIACGAVTPAGESFAARTVPTEADTGAQAVIGRIADVVAVAAREVRDAGRTVAGVAVASPGVVDPEGGAVSFATPALPGWAGAGLRDRLTELTGLRTSVSNDAHAAAWGEWRRGAGRGTADMLMVTVGTGIGGGVIAGGRLLLGSRGAAGRVGHVSVKVDGRPCPCGGAGCVEQYASGSAIARAAQAAINEMQDTSLRALPGAPTAADVLGAARAGDDCATRILGEAAWYLGGALATLVNLFNPAVIVLGGGLAEAGDLFLLPAAQNMTRWLPAVLSGSVAVRRAELGGQSAVIGAALLAWDRLGGGTGA